MASKAGSLSFRSLERAVSLFQLCHARGKRLHKGNIISPSPEHSQKSCPLRSTLKRTKRENIYLPAVSWWWLRRLRLARSPPAPPPSWTPSRPAREGRSIKRPSARCCSQDGSWNKKAFVRWGRVQITRVWNGPACTLDEILVFFCPPKFWEQETFVILEDFLYFSDRMILPDKKRGKLKIEGSKKDASSSAIGVLLQLTIEL